VCPFELAGVSDAVRQAHAQLDQALAGERHILVVAERGLDVEAVARAIHARSARKGGPFVVLRLDGGAGEMERALFGAGARASTRDVEQVGSGSALLRAGGGVLFVPGVGELSTTSQRRLARVLRDGEVRVSRRSAPVALDVLLIASAESTAGGELREDLLRRLPATIHVPALRHRREDVPAIAAAMLAARGNGHRFTPAALTVLAALPWQRNTAELSALIDRLVSGERDVLIRQEDVLAEMQLDRAPLRTNGTLRDARRQFERDYISSVLRAHEWQMREAARALGIERANLYRKVRQLGIPRRSEGDRARGGVR
jgi:DNA-binding NtrC family response regulator